MGAGNQGPGVELWLLVPSRARPWNVERFVRHCALTCTAQTRIHFAFDEDDPKLEDSVQATGGHRYTVGPRMSLAAWTNKLARRHMDAPFLGSFGDDMTPVTSGWDTELIQSVPPGGGVAYPNDQRRDDIPECSVISTNLVEALRGYGPVDDQRRPVMSHWYWDTALGDIARGAECLVYRPDVIVRHLHPNVPGGDRPDATYSEAAQSFDADLARYQRWRLRGMRADIAAVRRVREASLAAE